jgi:spore germination protein GerM
MGSRVRRPLLFAALLTLALTATACAIPTQGHPSTISNSKVPFNLMDPHPPTTTTTAPNNASFVSVKVFFLQGTNFVTAVRYVPPPAPLIAVVRALLRGVTSGETTAGMSTAIPSNVSVLSVSPPTAGLVTVNLTSAFGEITGTNTELAVGQIVWTVATEVGPSTGVIFEIEGQRTQVPITNGSLVPGPVYALNFLGGA